MNWSYMLWVLVVASLSIAIAALVRVETNGISNRKTFLGNRNRAGHHVSIPSSEFVQLQTTTDNRDINYLTFVQGKVNLSEDYINHVGLIYLHVKVGVIEYTHTIDPTVPSSTEFYVCFPTTKEDKDVVLSFDCEFEIPKLDVDYLQTTSVNIKPASPTL